MIYRPHHKKASKDGQIYEHRYIMELQLGRYLTNNEEIHHINGIKNDNRLENLMLCKDYKEHRKQHYKDLDNRICLICKSNKTNILIKNNKYKIPKWFKHDNGFLCAKCYIKTKRHNENDLKYKLQMELLKQFIN